MPQCRAAAGETPSAIFDSIHRDFLHGNLDLAQQRAERARSDFSERRAVADPGWAMKFRLLEAQILTYQGRRSDVIALLDCDDAAGLATGDAAIQRDSLCGQAHGGLGRWRQSNAEVREARRLAESTASPLMGEVLRTEALIEIDRNHLPEATALFERSLEAARGRGDVYLEATDLLNIGFASLTMGHYDEAVAQLNQAANFAKLIQARTVMEAALGNLGEAYLCLGDFEKALSNYLQAEREATAIGTSSAQVDWLVGAGYTYYKLGRLEEARQYDEQALRAAVAIKRSEEILNIDENLAFLFYRQGQFDAARKYSDDAIRVAGELGNRPAAVYPSFLKALLATREAGATAERLLLGVQAEAAGDPALRWDIENALAKFYAGRREPKRAELWFRRSIRTFDQQRSQVKDEELKLPFFANGEALYRDYADFLIDTHRPTAALRLLDRGRARTLEDGLGLGDRPSRPKLTDPQSVARARGASILFYSLGPERSFLWAVTAEETRLFTLPKRTEIDALAQAYQQTILKSSDPLREANQAAQDLFRVLIAPAAAMIRKDSKVILIPDGSLNGLNFETLLAPNGADFHYWIEDVTVSNASSIRLLAGPLAQRAPPQASNLLLIGNPLPAGGEYEGLSHAAAEIDGVEKFFPPQARTVLTQSRAVPTAYAASDPDRFAYIHFVAHGTANRLSPLDSAVVLSGAADGQQSYKLYARDIVRHPLHATLVTISACYGSGLRAYAGEGMVGLSWAFLRAGSQNVIGALWEASDASTPRLMERLYRELETGAPPDQALRIAKLSLLRSPDVYRKPFYWGAFQLYAG